MQNTKSPKTIRAIASITRPRSSTQIRRRAANILEITTGHIGQGLVADAFALAQKAILSQDPVRAFELLRQVSALGYAYKVGLPGPFYKTITSVREDLSA